MKSIEFKVIGKIRGKARPRFYGTSKIDTTKVNVRAYKSKNDKVYENIIKASYYEADGFKFPDNSYLRMTLIMYFSIPKSYPKKRKQRCIEGIERPAKKPDTDNVLKNVCDALNEVAYKDDIQVIEVISSKHYSQEEEDYIIVKIEDITNENIQKL